MPRFGYSPTEADQAKVGIDQDLSAIKHRVGKLRGAVTGAGAIPARLDAAFAEIEGIVDDLHTLIDERTEIETGARF